MRRIVTCLWFDGRIHEALALYTGLLPDARLVEISHHGPEAERYVGEVLSSGFTVQGHELVLLNGGPGYRHSPAISLQIHCDTQEEIDGLWERLGDGGEPGRCAWLADRFGISWQIVPAAPRAWMASAEPERSRRVSAALMRMDKLESAALEAAYHGNQG